MYGFCKKSLRKDAPQTKEYFFPHFLLISADLEKSEDKSVHWSEVHLSEVTFYKIHILIGLMILLNLSFFHYLLTLLALCTHPRSKRLLRTSCKRRVKGALGSTRDPKLYIPSTLNFDLILWHTQLIVYAVKFKIMV